MGQVETDLCSYAVLLLCGQLISRPHWTVQWRTLSRPSYYCVFEDRAVQCAI